MSGQPCRVECGGISEHPITKENISFSRLVDVIYISIVCSDHDVNIAIAIDIASTVYCKPTSLVRSCSVNSEAISAIERAQFNGTCTPDSRTSKNDVALTSEQF